MDNKMKIKVLIGLLSLFLSLTSQVAKGNETSFKYDCISINQNFKHIEQLIDQAHFRFSKHVSNNHNDEEGGKKLTPFSYQADQDFQHYINYARHLIQQKNPQANRPCPIETRTFKLLAKQNNWTKVPVVSQLIAPFELKPVPDERNAKHLSNRNPSKGILLIHGLTDSPFVFHDLAAFFSHQGFTVRTLLLPGHGTAAGDLIDISFKQWQEAANYGINRMLKDFDQVYLGGFSTGGALIFDHLMQQKSVDKKIKALMMWSPASKAKSELAWLAKYVDYIPFVDWIDVDADIDFAKYESFPYNAGAQVHELMSRIYGKSALKSNMPHDIPLFVVAGELDQTIDTAATLALMNNWHKPSVNAKNQFDTLVYYGETKGLAETLLPSIKIVAPTCEQGELCQKVFNIAHTSPINSPENPHYGKLGQYRNCGHYLANMERYQACKTSKSIIVGERTSENLQQNSPLKRLTFNPYYAQMLVTIKDFLVRIEK